MIREVVKGGEERILCLGRRRGFRWLGFCGWGGGEGLEGWSFGDGDIRRLKKDGSA